MELAPRTTSESLYQPPASQQIYESSLSPQYCGLLIEEYFAKRFPYQSKKDWIAQIKNGDILINGLEARTGYILKEGDQIVTHAGLRREPPANTSLKVVYEDIHIRVFKSLPHENCDVKLIGIEIDKKETDTIKYFI